MPRSKSKAVIPPNENETNNEELETLNQILAADSLKMVEVKQDPSNLFRALSDQERDDGGKDYRNAQKLRKHVTMHLLENEPKFGKHVAGDFHEHVTLVKTNPKTFGTDLEIIGWGDKNRRTVEVISATGTTCYEYEGPNPGGTARLSRHGGNHYNSIKPLDSVAITDAKIGIWGDDQNEELISHFVSRKLDPCATDISYIRVAFNTMSESTQALGFSVFSTNYVEKGAKYCKGDWMLLETFRHFKVKEVRTPKERKIHYERLLRLKATDALKSRGAANEPSYENEPSLVDEVHESRWDDYGQVNNRVQKVDGIIEEQEAFGNCLYLSWCDQMQDGQHHMEKRQQVCDFMESEEEKGRFMDMTGITEVDLKTKVQKMRKLGEWGDNEEIVALCLLDQRNVLIFNNETPIHFIFNDDWETVFLARHDDKHYNSVRNVSLNKLDAFFEEHKPTRWRLPLVWPSADQGTTPAKNERSDETTRNVRFDLPPISPPINEDDIDEDDARLTSQTEHADGDEGKSGSGYFSTQTIKALVSAPFSMLGFGRNDDLSRCGSCNEPVRNDFNSCPRCTVLPGNKQGDDADDAGNKKGPADDAASVTPPSKKAATEKTESNYKTPKTKSTLKTPSGSTCPPSPAMAKLQLSIRSEQINRTKRRKKHQARKSMLVLSSKAAQVSGVQDEKMKIAKDRKQRIEKEAKEQKQRIEEQKKIEDEKNRKLEKVEDDQLKILDAKEASIKIQVDSAKVATEYALQEVDDVTSKEESGNQMLALLNDVPSPERGEAAAMVMEHLAGDNSFDVDEEDADEDFDDDTDDDEDSDGEVSVSAKNAVRKTLDPSFDE